MPAIERSRSALISTSPPAPPPSPPLALPLVASMTPVPVIAMSRPESTQIPPPQPSVPLPLAETVWATVIGPRATTAISPPPPSGAAPSAVMEPAPGRETLLPWDSRQTKPPQPPLWNVPVTPSVLSLP